MAHPLSVPGAIEAAFSALQDLLLGEIVKTFFGLEKRKWFVVNDWSTVTLQQSKADGSLDPQSCIEKS